MIEINENFLKKPMTEKIAIALEKITRETGEDEDLILSELENEGISILKKNVIPSGRYTNIYIIESYKNSLEEKVRELSHQIIEYMKEHSRLGSFNQIKAEKRESVLYEFSIDSERIDEEIFEDLKNEHNIKVSELTPKEWFDIQTSDLWKRSQIQVAREITAREIIKLKEINLKLII
jgi:spore coat protein CotF